MACEWAPVYVVPVNEVPANGVYEREPCSGGERTLFVGTFEQA